MKGRELTALAEERGAQVFVLADEDYELGEVHEGLGYERDRFFQDVLACGTVIFSIPAPGVSA